MQPSPFKLERYFAQYEFDVPFLACASDCESFSICEILSWEPGAQKTFLDMHLGYTESLGNPLLREEISKLYTDIKPDQVLVHSGAEEAIFNFMNVVLQKENHVIVHWPCYQSLFEIANQIGCSVSKWQVNPKNNWEMELNNLENLIQPNTKLLIINCPHNPTGYLMPKKDWISLSQICEKNSILIFSDEVYRFLEYDEADRLSAFCDLNERAVSLGVMSKSFGLPGLRIGWVATRNQKILEQLAAFKDYTTICNSAPSEFLAILALKNREQIIHRNLKIIMENMKILDSFFKNHQNRFSWPKPKAGPIAFPSLREEESKPFCQNLVRDAGILLLPGSLYGDEFARHFRVGFGRKNFPECIEQLDQYIETH